MLLLLLFIFSISFAGNRAVIGIDFMGYQKSSPDEVLALLEDMYQKSVNYHNQMSTLYRMYQNSFTPEELSEISNQLSELSNGIERLNSLKNEYASGFNNSRKYFDTIYTVRNLQMTISSLERYVYPIPNLSPQPYVFTEADAKRLVKVNTFRRLLQKFMSEALSVASMVFGGFFADVLLDFAYVQDPNQIIRRLMLIRKYFEYNPTMLNYPYSSPYIPDLVSVEIPSFLSLPDFCRSTPPMHCNSAGYCKRFCVVCGPNRELYFTSGILLGDDAPRCPEPLTEGVAYITFVNRGHPCVNNSANFFPENIQNHLFEYLLRLAHACLGVSYCRRHAETRESFGLLYRSFNEFMERLDEKGLHYSMAFHILPRGYLTGEHIPDELRNPDICVQTGPFPGEFIIPKDSNDVVDVPFGRQRGFWRPHSDPDAIFYQDDRELWAPTTCIIRTVYAEMRLNKCGSLGRLCIYRVAIPTGAGIPRPTGGRIVTEYPVTCQAFTSPYFQDVADWFPNFSGLELPSPQMDLLRRLRELVRQRQELLRRYPHALPYIPSPTLTPEVYLSPDFLPLPDVPLKPISYASPDGQVTFDLQDIKPYLDGLLKEELEHIIPYINTIQTRRCSEADEVLMANFNDLFDTLRYSFIAFAVIFGIMSGALGGFSIYNFIRNLSLWRL